MEKENIECYGSDGERKSGGKRGEIVLTVRCWRGEGSGGGEKFQSPHTSDRWGGL